ncbi:MAG: winged helix-turn-helix transcriptional regulator [Kiritimatiellae bacterium]|nr:winged helix-turn-helix transcriptional regulator [Kiritimatiellia bacterium]
MAPAKKTPAKAAPDLEIWRRMVRISDLFRRVVKKGSGGEDLSRITVNQARIFGYIFSRGESDDIRISRLARDLDVTPAAAGQAVDRLVKSGLVDRRVDPADRRAFVISVSPRGREYLRDYAVRSREVSDAILGGLPAADVAAFDRVLAAIYDALAARWEEILSDRERGAEV